MLVVFTTLLAAIIVFWLFVVVDTIKDYRRSDSILALIAFLIVETGLCGVAFMCGINAMYKYYHIT